MSVPKRWVRISGAGAFAALSMGLVFAAGAAAAKAGKIINVSWGPGETPDGPLLAHRHDVILSNEELDAMLGID